LVEKMQRVSLRAGHLSLRAATSGERFEQHVSFVAKRFSEAGACSSVGRFESREFASFDLRVSFEI
jgi:hypothetical protein